MANKKASAVISQKWEYTKVFCCELVLEFDENKEQVEYFHIPERRKKVAIAYKLDPAIPLPSNERVTWQLAWSDKHNHWANITKALNEIGEEGWELVSVTPPWNSVSMSSVSVNVTGAFVEPNYYTNRHYFYLLLKRPKN